MLVAVCAELKDLRTVKAADKCLKVSDASDMPPSAKLNSCLNKEPLNHLNTNMIKKIIVPSGLKEVSQRKENLKESFFPMRDFHFPKLDSCQTEYSKILVVQFI